jgi:hypothetical protein
LNVIFFIRQINFEISTMGRKAIISAAALILLLANSAYTQMSRVTYFMKIPQNHLLNPAIKPANRFFIGLPVLSGFNASLGNNFLELSDILTPGLKADSIISFQNPNFDLAALAAKLKDKNTISAEAGIQVLGLGFPVGKNYGIFIDITDRFTGKFLFPKELLDLYFMGPADFADKTLNLSEINLTAQYFREYGLGFSGNVTKNLRVGARVKLLSGIASMSFDNRAFSLKVNPDLSQTVTADAMMDVSGKETIAEIFGNNNFIFKSDSAGKADILGFAGDYLKNPVSNSGLGLDIGITYNLGKLLTLSASVTDFGFINWKDDLKSWNANGTFSLPGITFEDVVNQTFSIDDMIGRLRDSIKSNFEEVASPQRFKTYLPTGIIAGASINLLPVISFGVLSESRIYAGSLKQSFILSGNVYAGRTFSGSLTYTVANYSYDNLGIGIAFKAGFAQIYIIADKIPLSWDKVYFPKSGSSDYFGIPMPSHLNVLSLQMGMNIAFGKPVTKKIDKPMLIEPEQK